jgi:hypothetical protein
MLGAQVLWAGRDLYRITPAVTQDFSFPVSSEGPPHSIAFYDTLGGVEDVKLIRYQFWCTRCAFRILKCLQWFSGRKSWKSEKRNCENCTRAEKNWILCHEIESNPSKDRAMHEGDNPSFWDEFIKFKLFLTVLFIFVFFTKYRST